MNDGKVCFIMCVNDEAYEKEAMLYISRLYVPEGMEVEVLSIRNAESICSGYNEAMSASDARYKVYLHQDTFLGDRNIIYEMLEAFIDKKVGILGATGVTKMSPDMVMSYGERFISIGDKFTVADAVDGYFLATQYDIPWREDLFDKWDLYDVSQCGEFKKQGYRILLLNPESASKIIHHKKVHRLREFETYRKIALDEYAEVYGIDRLQKKIALVYFKEISFDDMAWGLLQSGYEATIIDTGATVDSKDKDDIDFYVRQIMKNHVDAVLSFDFGPALSEACKECSIKYGAWIYDAPQKALYENEVRNENNYIFSFDKAQILRTREWGAKKVFYLPLAGNIARGMSLNITEEDKKKYSCEVSFIGNLYKDNLYPYAEKAMSEETRREYNTIIADAYGKWDGINRISGRLSKNALEELTHLEEGAFGENFKMDLDDFFCARLIARYVAQKERIEMLTRLSKFKLKFFTNDQEIEIPGVRSLPPLSHSEELPKAYALSKININSTLHSITSGVPLRVFEIMAMGGFVLSNYQPEIEALFDIGKEIEVYHCFDEMEDKVRFYLSHDRLRKDIAENGYRAIKNRYNYEKQVKKMIATMFES